jgi:NADPH-dependent curcumin reductase CurA
MFLAAAWPPLILLWIAVVSTIARATQLPSTITSTPSTTTLVNHKWVLTSYPTDYFECGKHSKLVKEVIELNGADDDADADASKLIVIQVEALSIDAFLRTLLANEKNAVHGSLRVSIGGTLPALGIGVVLQSPTTCPYQPGDRVSGLLGGQTYCCIPMAQSFLVSSEREGSVEERRRSVEKPASSSAFPPLTWRGTSGLAAYMGMYQTLGPPRRGQTVVVSAAAGATGSYAVQLAQLCGARVVGVASTRKQSWLTNTLHVDAAIASLQAQLDEACPNGVDFVFDNVGGPLLDTLLDRINKGGRVVISGAISQYSAGGDGDGGFGPSNYLKLAEQSATMKGFNLFNFSKQQTTSAKRKLLHLIRTGKLTSHEQIEVGIESFGPALEMLFKGGNTGKLLVDLNTEPPLIEKKRRRRQQLTNLFGFWKGSDI